MDDDDPLPTDIKRNNRIGGESLPLTPNPLIAIAISVFVPQPGYVGGFSVTPSRLVQVTANYEGLYAF